MTALALQDETRPFQPGDTIRDEEGETATFLRYSDTGHFAFLRYDTQKEWKLPIAGLQLISRAHPILSRAMDVCAKHQVQPSQAECFRFSRPDEWAHSCGICWVPGFVFIHGDLGQLTICHYQAMPTFNDAMVWLATSEPDYLISKTDAKEVIDKNKTLAYLKDWQREAEEYGEPTAEFADLIQDIERADEHEIPALIHAANCAPDYYGSYSYPFQVEFQIRCAKLAAKAWIDQQGASS